MAKHLNSHRRHNQDMNLIKFHSDVIANEGASVSLNIETPKHGAFISLSGHEKRFNRFDFTIEAVKEYVKQNIELLCDERNFLGGWYDKGYYYLDISDHWSLEEYTLEGLLEIGRLRGQKAIYVASKGCSEACFDAFIDGDCIYATIEVACLLRSEGYRSTPTSDPLYPERFPFISNKRCREVLNEEVPLTFTRN